MITVVTPATSRLLTTLTRVKLELDISGSTYDTVLNTKIAEVSDSIVAFCGREFGRTIVTETLRREYWTDDIVLSRWPVTAVAVISEDGTALETTDWELDGPYGRLRRINSGVLSYWPTGTVAITYTYGWKLPGETGRDLPFDVEAAAVEQVKADWFLRQRDPALRSETVDGVGSQTFQTSGMATALAPSVAARLQSYVIMRIG